MNRTFAVGLLVLAGTAAAAAQSPASGLEKRFSATVLPFLETYCLSCHSGPTPMAQFDLKRYTSLSAVVADHPHWVLLKQKLAAREMPPASMKQPSGPERRNVIEWVEALLKEEARRNAGYPGIVLARRLSNAEYNYTIRDLTGVDLKLAQEFPVDPANPAGFDNSGESLAMSPALLNKYLQAAREVANHMVLKPGGIAFAPHLVLADTDRDKYCVQRIIDFYLRQPTNYSDYFRTAWAFKHRAALGHPKATLQALAAVNKVSPKYLATIWRTLEETREEIGPLAKLQSMWRDLPAPKGRQPDVARPGCDRIRDFVVALRKKIELRHPSLSVTGIRATSQPFLMWRNRTYAANRTNYDRTALQVEGEPPPARAAMERARVPADNDDEQPPAPAHPAAPDPHLQVPAGRRAAYEAAFARFSEVFPDAFYVSERGRYFPDNTRDTGRHLSAGFHNLMGYFRDDLPLYELILDPQRQKELDELWRELDFIASANIRTYVQFYLNESGEVREPVAGMSADAEQRAITSEARIRRVAENYLVKARQSGNAAAIQAVQQHFDWVDEGIRWVERARIEAEPRHLEELVRFASRAYRRPLAAAEAADLIAYYRRLRRDDGMSHEDAMRDCVVAVLMAPDFCYRIDLVEGQPKNNMLPGHALASRLSYFLWSSMPDEELLSHAASLHQPAVIAAQARRMLKDDRASALAVEFAGNWLDFRRFEEHNAVDRERFSIFSNELRQAMFEEPVHFLADVIRNDRSVLDALYANHTFVNASLARHYEMNNVEFGPEEWMKIEDARPYGRGGILPMAVFLTKNAPGLRTSPVKRGYWVVKRVLGEEIPPPPAAVPELPSDEAKIELPLRQLLARHREHPGCASCHARFDSLGVALEGYGPVGERRAEDLAGRHVDSRTEFPGGAKGEGLDGLRNYIRTSREKDYLENLCRKILVYGLGRSLILSDEPLIDSMRSRLGAGGNRFSVLIESVVTSPQFLRKAAGPAQIARKGD